MEETKQNGPSGPTSSTEGILVGIRMRPLNDKEIAAGQEKIYKCMNTYNAITQLKDGHAVEGQMFYYDKVFDEKSSTCAVYDQIGKDIVKGVVSGINGTIFACKYLLIRPRPATQFQNALLTLLLHFHSTRRPNKLW